MSISTESDYSEPIILTKHVYLTTEQVKKTIFFPSRLHLNKTL